MVELARGLRGQRAHRLGGRRPAARIDEAQAAGAALNVWDADPALVATGRTAPRRVEVTWAGPPPKADGGAGGDRAWPLAQAGATWAVFGWPVDPALLVAAARAADAVTASSGEPEAGS